MNGVGYLNYSGSKNELYASETFTESTSEWTFSISNDLVTLANVAINARMLQFNYNNGNSRFACYTSNQVKLTLFKYTGTVVLTPSISAENVSIESDATGGSISYTITNGVEGGALSAATDDTWITLGTVGETIPFTCEANTGAQRTAIVTLTYTYNTNQTVTKEVTVTQAAYVAPFEGGTYTLATSIESGNTYIITSELLDDEIYAMGADRGNNRGAVSVAIDETTITVEPGQEVYEFVITSLDDPQGFYSIYDPRNAGYLYAAGGTSSNHLKTKAELDNKGQWTITFGENNEASVVANFGNEKANNDPRNTMRFNSSNNPPIFSCYATGGQNDVYLYKKVETTPSGYTLEIAGFGTDNTVTTGWNLIASPVTTNIEDVTNMLSNTYDLYYYDDAQDLEWINYKQTNGTHPFTTLEPGKGYLYANSNNVTLTFTGEPYDDVDEGMIEIGSGWNLIGNPYGVDATISGVDDYYALDPTESDLTVKSYEDPVAAMQGIFVYGEGNNSFVDFDPIETESAASNLKSLALNVTGTRGNVIDRAIVRFGEGRQLPKFQLNKDNTKIYFAQADNDYAVVSSDNEGEMPVSFKAAENGTYTISFNAENTEMRYMHLIDNMTGNDIDLLATPSYSFEAKTTDYASRFRLVFSTGDADVMGEEHFAFYNGSEWVINSEGEATLQVIDMTGRVLTSETINGNANVKVNQASGVYVMRLIQNGQVRSQKIVKD